jgi:hypothetical protein
MTSMPMVRSRMSNVPAPNVTASSSLTRTFSHTPVEIVKFVPTAMVRSLEPSIRFVRAVVNGNKGALVTVGREVRSRA